MNPIEYTKSLVGETLNYFVYIVKCSDNTLYTGYTSNLEQRYEYQPHGYSGGRYTRTRRPVTLVFVEIFQSQREAIKRELAIKKRSREEKLNLIKLSPIKPPVFHDAENDNSE